ncbi:SGNH/GDSL hydrolase family protein [Verrucomicrobiota bacterium]
MRLVRLQFSAMSLLLAASASPSMGAQDDELVSGNAGSRRDQLVKACVQGVHAHQIRLCRKEEKGDSSVFSAPRMDGAALAALVQAHRRILQADADELVNWADRASSSFSAKADLDKLLNADLRLEGRLPVVVAEEAFIELNAPVSSARIKALANVMQVVLEVERDQYVLQEQMDLYERLGLLISPSELGLKDDNDTFLTFGEQVAGKCCEAPYATDAPAWQISLRKLQNWASKRKGLIGPGDYAEELLQRDDIRPLLPRIRSMPPRRFLVIGHSYVHPLHWSSSAKMNEILAAVFEKENPGVVFSALCEGLLDTVKARKRFLPRGLDSQPDFVLFVIDFRGDEGVAALRDMVREFREGGARVACFDQYWPGNAAEGHQRALTMLRDEEGLELIEAWEVLNNHPKREDFLCLDGIHMRPSYHMAMAGEILKHFVNASDPQAQEGQQELGVVGTGERE